MTSVIGCSCSLRYRQRVIGLLRNVPVNPRPIVRWANMLRPSGWLHRLMEGRRRLEHAQQPQNLSGAEEGAAAPFAVTLPKATFVPGGASYAVAGSSHLEDGERL